MHLPSRPGVADRRMMAIVDERSGRLTLLWPDSVPAFREHGAHFDPRDFDPTSPAIHASRTVFAPVHGV